MANVTVFEIFESFGCPTMFGMVFFAALVWQLIFAAKFDLWLFLNRFDDLMSNYVLC